MNEVLKMPPADVLTAKNPNIRASGPALCPPSVENNAPHSTRTACLPANCRPHTRQIASRSLRLMVAIEMGNAIGLFDLRFVNFLCLRIGIVMIHRRRELFKELVTC